ncbi:hypothetical protein TCON_0566 [Astathelohania contejeani]|uniref:Uncharacterized protein n=1 Tax=Astathelohania contejeani TaxID=164912 RepID=A0ABQ7I1F4_9MICR|nr:hypothetical protein TCON_0566 [Thelohania contejeani]
MDKITDINLTPEKKRLYSNFLNTKEYLLISATRDILDETFMTPLFTDQENEIGVYTMFVLRLITNTHELKLCQENIHDKIYILFRLFFNYKAKISAFNTDDSSLTQEDIDKYLFYLLSECVHCRSQGNAMKISTNNIKTYLSLDKLPEAYIRIGLSSWFNEYSKCNIHNLINLISSCNLDAKNDLTIIRNLNVPLINISKYYKFIFITTITLAQRYLTCITSNTHENEKLIIKIWAAIYINTYTCLKYNIKPKKFAIEQQINIIYLNGLKELYTNINNTIRILQERTHTIIYQIKIMLAILMNKIYYGNSEFDFPRNIDFIFNGILNLCNHFPAEVKCLAMVVMNINIQKLVVCIPNIEMYFPLSIMTAHTRKRIFEENMKLKYNQSNQLIVGLITSENIMEQSFMDIEHLAQISIELSNSFSHSPHVIDTILCNNQNISIDCYLNENSSILYKYFTEICQLAHTYILSFDTASFNESNIYEFLGIAIGSLLISSKKFSFKLSPIIWIVLREETLSLESIKHISINLYEQLNAGHLINCEIKIGNKNVKPAIHANIANQISYYLDIIKDIFCNNPNLERFKIGLQRIIYLPSTNLMSSLELSEHLYQHQ